MAHPLIEEFSRIPGVQNCQPHVFNRVQRELKSTIQPMLDERDALVEAVTRLTTEKAVLLADIEDLKALLIAGDIPVKRGPGRPRKATTETVGHGLTIETKPA